MSICYMYKGNVYDSKESMHKEILNDLNNIDMEGDSGILIEHYMTEGRLHLSEPISESTQVPFNQSVEHRQYILNSLRKQTPQQLQDKITDMTMKQLNNKTRAVFNEIFEKIGKKHNVQVNFVNANNNLFGFYKDGTINFNKKYITLDTYVHEFSHLWIKVIKTSNKPLYDTIMNLTKNVMEKNNPFSTLIKNKLYGYKGDALLEEAAAIFTGFVSIPSLLKYAGLNYFQNIDEVNAFIDTFKAPLEEVYSIVSELLNGITDVETRQLYHLAQTFVNDMINGDNIFNLQGITSEQLKYISDLKGYMENATENKVPTISTSSDAFALFVDSIKKIGYKKQSDEDIERFIKNNKSHHLSVNKTGKKMWVLSGDSVEVQEVNGELTHESIEAIKDKIRNFSATWTNMFIRFVNERNRVELKDKSDYDIASEIFQTSNKNPMFTDNDIKNIMSLMHIDEGVHKIGLLSQFLNDGTIILDNSHKHLFADIDPLIILHDDPNFTKNIDISIFSFEKIINYMSSGNLQNVFRKFADEGKGLTDARISKEGINLKNTFSSIQNMELATLVSALSMSNEGVRVRGIGTIEGKKSFKADTNTLEALFTALSYTKNNETLKESWYNYLPFELQRIIDNIADNNLKGINQTALGKLKAFYHQSRFYKQLTNYDYSKRLGGKDFFSLPTDNMIEIIKGIMSDMSEKLGKDSLSNPEFILLSEAFFELNENKYTDKGVNRGTSNDFIKWIQLPSNLNSFVVQKAINIFRANEIATVDELREFQKKRDKLLAKVYKRRSSYLSKIMVVDEGSKIFKHMFKTTMINGQEVTLPFLHHTLDDVETKRLYNQGVLNQDDIDLSNMILDEIEEQMIRKLMVEAKNVSGMTAREYAEERLQSLGYDRKRGQYFVIGKTVNEVLFQNGNIGLAFDLWKRRTLEHNAIFTDSVMLEEIDKFNNIYEAQLEVGNLLAHAGISIDDNGNYVLDSKQKNDLMSTNVESISNYTMFASIRDRYHNKDSHIVYRAAQSFIMEMDRHATEYDSKGYKNLLEQLNLYYDSFILQKSDTKYFSDKLGMKEGAAHNIGASLMMARDSVSMMFLGYSPRVSLRSAAWNYMYGSLFTLGNTLGGDKNLPGMQHFHKAMAIYTANPRKAMAWGRHYQVANASSWEIMGGAFQNKTKKYITNTQFAHSMNQYTDEMFRHITMISIMLKDGSWDAHDYFVSNGEVVLTYDEKKDKRMYDDNGNITEEGKVLREGIIMDLVREKKMTGNDTKLPQGYSYDDYIMFKAIADKWVIGSYSLDAAAFARHKLLGKLVFMFRAFAPDKFANMGLGVTNTKSVLISHRKVLRDENGNLVSKREQQQIIGTIQSFIKAADTLWQFRKLSFDEMNKLTPTEKANILRALSTMAMMFGFWLLFGKFKDKEDRTKYLIDFYDLMLDMNILGHAQEFSRSPVPLVSALTRMSSKLVKDPLGMWMYIPGTKLWSDYKRVINFYEKEVNK